MRSSLRRGALAAATVAFAIVPLAACGAGFDAETNLVTPPNASVEVEDIKIQGVNVIVSEEGQAAVSGRIFNGGGEDQTLLAVVVGDSREEAELIPAEGESRVVIPAGGSIALGGEGNPAAYIADAEAAGIALGNAQAIVFDLSETGPAELNATVVPAGGDDGAFAYYEQWGPTAPPEAEDAAGSPGTGTETGPGTDEGAGEDAEPGTEEGAAEGEGAPGTEDGDAEGAPGDEETEGADETEGAGD